MDFKGHCSLRPGPSGGVTLVVVNGSSDEDGSRASVELDLSIEMAEALASDLQTVVAWRRGGVWK